MKHWPVPNSYSKEIPTEGSSGSFWEDRGDRYHCGIDIYAPEGSEVLSVEDGKVIDIGIFTSPEIIPYWNTTYYAIIQNKTGLVCKYAELGIVAVNLHETVNSCQLIGHVGLVLNIDKITEKSPKYIQKLKKNKNRSMLHFELYNSIPKKSKMYSGGNWFDKSKPDNLLNPATYLKSIANSEHTM